MGILDLATQAAVRSGVGEQQRAEAAAKKRLPAAFLPLLKVIDDSLANTKGGTFREVLNTIYTVTSEGVRSSGLSGDAAGMATLRELYTCRQTGYDIGGKVAEYYRVQTVIGALHIATAS